MGILDLPIDLAYSLVVPAYDESPETVERLLESCDIDTLVTLVVNRGPESPANIKINNNHLIDWALERSRGHQDVDVQGCVGHLCRYDDLPDVLLIDLNRDENVIVGGVGRARQMGCDLAVYLHNHGRIRSPWIHNTDSDSILPESFFQDADERYTEKSALAMRVVRSFSEDPDLQSFGDLHDVATHMVVIGLERSRCPWAFWVGGCGISVSARAYMQCGGVPAYVRAEDGHLINIASKQGSIHRIYGDPVLVEARPISRPPAGFGTTIQSVRDGILEGKKICATNPEVWPATMALYGAIEACVTQGLSVPVASAQATAQAGCPAIAKRIEGLIYEWVGPIDAMVQCMNARDLYESIHLDLDLRKSRKAIMWPEYEPIPVMDVIRGNVWAGASEAKTIKEAVDLVYATEAKVCSGDTGPLVWTDRLFPT